MIISNNYYYMAQITSGKTARCDLLVTWQDFSAIINALGTKTNKKIL